MRSDIRSSFGSSSTVAEGVPLTINAHGVDTATGCSRCAGAAVYVWHCDLDGGYSMYSQGVSDENYLRGVQETDANGTVTFTSIFPAAYSGRWPHIHFEVYPSLADGDDGRNKIGDVADRAARGHLRPRCTRPTATARACATWRRRRWQTDNVFSDGWTLQVPTFTGSPTAGYVATIPVGV